MELELVKIDVEPHEYCYFVPFYILVPKGTSFEEIMETYYKDFIDDDFIFNDAVEEYYEHGRIEFIQEDAYTLGLEVGDIL